MKILSPASVGFFVFDKFLSKPHHFRLTSQIKINFKPMKLIAYILEIIAWFIIALIPTVLGCGLGALIYYAEPTKFRLALGILLGLMGLVGGVLWATHVSRTKGALKFITRYPHDHDENNA